MAITIELPQSLQIQAEAYAEARGQSIAELMVAGLKQILASETESNSAIADSKGVETDAEFDFFRSRQCQSFQGFLFAKPFR